LYIESANAGTPDLSGISGGWQVQPDQVRGFADAARTVRQGIDQIRQVAESLASAPPLLGTSSVGNGLSSKFLERAGPQGLVGELMKVLTQLEDFSAKADAAAADYEAKDNAAAAVFNHSA
jgi:hypothetical protein